MGKLSATLRTSWTALRLLLIATLVLGLAYPVVILGIGQALFPHTANGSIVTVDGQPVGSSLLGPNFGDQPEWFHGRTPAASASGADPHIGAAEALAQVDRIAQARDLPVADVTRLVESTIQGAGRESSSTTQFGEEIVDVLSLNLALHALSN